MYIFLSAYIYIIVLNFKSESGTKISILLLLVSPSFSVPPTTLKNFTLTAPPVCLLVSILLPPLRTLLSLLLWRFLQPQLPALLLPPLSASTLTSADNSQHGGDAGTYGSPLVGVGVSVVVWAGSPDFRGPLELRIESGHIHEQDKTDKSFQHDPGGTWPVSDRVLLSRIYGRL